MSSIKKEDITSMQQSPTSLVMSSIIFYEILLTKVQMIIMYPNYKSVQHLVPNRYSIPIRIHQNIA